MNEMNERLTVLIQGESCFATAVYGILDLQEYELRFCGAGHPSPFLFHPDGKMDLLDTKGFPLGMVDSPGYELKRIPLKPGLMLLFYSDGATECFRPDGKMISTQGFQEILTECKFDGSSNSLTRVEESLLKVGNSLFLNDDLILLSVHLR